jgi:hypothetical protein
MDPEPEPQSNLSKVGTGTVKISYSSTTLKAYCKPPSPPPTQKGVVVVVGGGGGGVATSRGAGKGQRSHG